MFVIDARSIESQCVLRRLGIKILLVQPRSISDNHRLQRSGGGGRSGNGKSTPATR
ncbi:hypothetical protein RSSM_01807 [Rhodopirellula sallentina SM41]|uniref:Uncharacterized protein n=1 Tax=Rhodopirellula sallentina SM41 TaxID=1263870 RepID=M5U5P1_9BACT|nr:hypothetical protein RSSM_01807 [Rhodopirellula sallentina SM41]